MYLVTAATVFEMEAFSRTCSSAVECAQLITGIGPVEAAVQVAVYLAKNAVSFQGVINAFKKNDLLKFQMVTNPESAPQGTELYRINHEPKKG